MLSSAFSAMADVNSNPDFIIITGDFAAHSQPSFEESATAIRNVTQTLQSYFPSTIVIPAIGNNDVYPDYNMSVCNSEQVAELGQIWGKWIPNDQIGDFQYAGTYIYPLPHLNLDVIVLNTVFWSVKDKYDNITNPDPCGQFQWLENSLHKSCHGNNNVWVIGHMAPVTDNWRSDYITTFLNIISNYSTCISAMLFGHTHQDQFMIFDYNQTSHTTKSKVSQSPPISGLLAPSITIDFNNPSFRSVSYNVVNMGIVDYQTFYLDINKANKAGKAVWELEYSFRNAYGVPDLSPASLETVLVNLFANTTMYDEYNMRQTAQYDNARWTLLCTTMASSTQEYWTCRSQY
eukprot:TRINITY_DN8404_c1_g1_i2.p1 TRINITY_DN8404_c1_g1~~TRINITY_DN8404_c1_g1_i2.p1  ORF type:complete len:347 (+),score=44.49 TRINITY_DN8404_c1_g1_i2:173-1213(+)